MKTFTFLFLLIFINIHTYAQEAIGFTVRDNWLETCNSGSLTIEDFAGGPSDTIACGSIVSNTGDSCFPTGEIQEGFSLTTEDGSELAFLATNLIRNSAPVIGPNLNRFTVINFDRLNITRVGLQLFNQNSETGIIRVYDTNGFLIDTLNFNTPGTNITFFGILTTVPIGRLELEGEASNRKDVFLRDLLFGNCVEDCDKQFYYPEGSFPFNIDIDPGNTFTADCENAPNLIPITVDSAGTIGIDATLTSVSFNIEHTATGDLQLSLISPIGTELLIVANRGSFVDNGYNGTIFADDGLDITQATAPFGNAIFAAQGGRFDSTFFGESITGDWMIKICDDISGQTGQVLNIALEICASVNAPKNDLIENAIDVDALGFPYTDSNINFPYATTDNVVNNSCDGLANKSVWYKLTTTTDRTISANFDNNLAIETIVVFYSAPDENATLDTLTFEDSGTNVCDFGINTSIDALANQTYYLLVISPTIGSVTIESEASLSIEENTIEGFSFFPNPVDEILTVQATQSIEQVALYNIHGQKILNKKVNASNTQLQLENLTTGIYYMIATGDGKQATYKVIKR